MIIGVDIDEVLFPLKKTFYSYLNRRFNWDLDWRTPHYLFGADWGRSMEEGAILYAEFTDTLYFREMAPILGADEGMRALNGLSEEVWAITARANFLREATEESLERHFTKTFSGFEMGNHYNFRTGGAIFSKLELCAKRNVSLLVEDQVKYATELSKTIPVILFDRPWNQGFGAENVYRAKSWGEIVNIAASLIN